MARKPLGDQTNQADVHNGSTTACCKTLASMVSFPPSFLLSPPFSSGLPPPPFLLSSSHPMDYPLPPLLLSSSLTPSNPLPPSSSPLLLSSPLSPPMTQNTIKGSLQPTVTNNRSKLPNPVKSTDDAPEPTQQPAPHLAPLHPPMVRHNVPPHPQMVRNNPQHCAEYAHEIIEYLRKIEVRDKIEMVAIQTNLNSFPWVGGRGFLNHTPLMFPACCFIYPSLFCCCFFHDIVHLCFHLCCFSCPSLLLPRLSSNQLTTT